MKDNDAKIIRLVGKFSLGLGIILMFATIISTIFVLYQTSTFANSITIKTVAQLILSLGMALAISACGSQIARFNPPLLSDVQSLRLGWTALLVSMIIATVFGANLMPPLGFIALAEALLLLAIRQSVIRASGS